MENTKENQINTEYHSVFWISSLRDSEVGLSRRMRDEIKPMLINNGISFRCYDIYAVDDFHKSIGDLIRIVKEGENPIIHIDMHGSQNDGLFICGERKFISWKEIYDRFVEINALTRNNLFVFSWACWGIKLADEVNIEQPCAYRTIIAPKREVEAGFLEDNIPNFYRVMFENRNVTDAYKIIRDEFSLGIAEIVALPILAGFLANILIDRKEIRNETWNTPGLGKIKRTGGGRKLMQKINRSFTDPLSLTNRKIIDYTIKNYMHDCNSSLNFWAVHREYKKIDLKAWRKKREDYRRGLDV